MASLHAAGAAFCAVLAIACAVSLAACGGNPSAPTDVGEGEHGESGSESGSENERGESGIRYGLSETANEIRSGVNLVISYDEPREKFNGTVTNTTNATVSNVRVEVHLSSGIELGPTARMNLTPGQARSVELDASGQTFTWWTVHVEVGSAGS